MSEEEKIDPKKEAFGCIVATAFFLSIVFLALIKSGEPKQSEKDPGYKIAPSTKYVDSLETV